MNKHKLDVAVEVVRVLGCGIISDDFGSFDEKAICPIMAVMFVFGPKEYTDLLAEAGKLLNCEASEVVRFIRSFDGNEEPNAEHNQLGRDYRRQLMSGDLDNKDLRSTT